MVDTGLAVDGGGLGLPEKKGWAGLSGNGFAIFGGADKEGLTGGGGGRVCVSWPARIRSILSPSSSFEV